MEDSRLSQSKNLEISNLWKIFHRNKRIKYFWLAVLTMCSVIFLYQSANRLFLLALSVPKSATVKLQFAERLEFPAVTVCPGYRFRASIFRHFAPLERTGCYYNRDKCNWNFPWFMTTATESIFKKCSFRRHLNCLPGVEQKGKWTRILSSLGRCFTYDSGEYVTCGGDLNALKFIVDPQTWDSVEPISFSGIRIFIHDSNEIPLFEITGTNVNEGASAAFALELQQFNWLPDNRRHPCTVNSSYSRSRCITSCIQKTAMKLADVGCRAPFMMGETRVCNLRKEIGSLTTAFDSVVKNGSSWNRCLRVCPQLCQETIYTPITSSLGYANSDRKNDSLIRIKIYIRDMWLETITEVWDYEFDEFIADVGGSLNLFLGASFVTVIQLLDATITKLWFNIRKTVVKQWGKVFAKSETADQMF